MLRMKDFQIKKDLESFHSETKKYYFSNNLLFIFTGLLTKRRPKKLFINKCSKRGLENFYNAILSLKLLSLRLPISP